MSFFGVPLSGLIAAQDALQSVSNNLANLDTVGYKDQTTSFSDIFAQSSATNGEGDPIESGLGTEASSTTSDFSDGTTTETDVPSNMALSGDGFFVTESTAGTVSYTRAGDFTTNSSGEIVTTGGDTVMGYPATNGVVDSTAALQPLTVNLGSAISATPTSEFTVPSNLDSAATTGTTFTSTAKVYDSLGSPITVSVDYTKTASNTWSYSVDVPNTVTGATPSTGTTSIASGTMSFDSSGNLTSPTGSVALSIPTLADGAASLSMNWDLSNTSGAATITQTDQTSTNGTSTQDGYAAGTLSSYSISSNGTIEGVYSNGVTSALGQVAVATFGNEQGLSQAGTSTFTETAASGVANVGVAGTGGRATIAGGYTESSNVDVASEFSKMIVAQEAYQANAKTVTTLDTIAQDTVAMLSN